MLVKPRRHPGGTLDGSVSTSHFCVQFSACILRFTLFYLNLLGPASSFQMGSICITGLPSNTTEQDLRTHLSTIGVVNRIVLQRALPFLWLV